MTQIIIIFSGLISRFVNKIIYCNQISFTQHQKIGYTSKHSVVIHNGFDIEKFQPQPQDYVNLRNKLELNAEVKIIGIVARFDPQKDYPNFLEAAKIVHQQNKKVHFVLVGRKVDSNNSELMELIRKFDIESCVHLMGEQNDIPKFMNGFDVYCLSSSSEGFPNSLGEAMACGVPCVATSTGAAADILGNYGVLVPIRDSKALAAGMNKLLNLSNEDNVKLKQDCVKHIQNNFSIKNIAGQYYNLYSELS